MELGILPDDRRYSHDEEYPLTLTPKGRDILAALRPVLESLNLEFPRGDDGIPSTRMRDNEANYNETIRNLIDSSPEARKVFFSTFLNMSAVQQMMRFLYHVCQEPTIRRKTIYSQFFQAPFVKQFCDQEGIEEATETAAEHRCPFLLNILDACGIIESGRNEITIQRLLLMPTLVKPVETEDDAIAKARLAVIRNAWPANADSMDPQNLSIVRELFGKNFLTDKYFLKNFETFEG